MTKRQKVAAWVLLAAAAIVLPLSVLVATGSNYGFRMRPFIAEGENFAVALPWKNDYANAEDLRRVTGADRVSRFTADSLLVSWTGSSGVNFPVRAPESYVLHGPPGGIAPLISGAHDADRLVDFVKGANLVSPPLHQTYRRAEYLRYAIDSHSHGAVERVCKFSADMALVCWTRSSGYNFPLAPGMGVVVYVKRDVDDFEWEHY